MPLSIFLFIFVYAVVIASLALAVLVYDFSRRKKSYIDEIMKEIFLTEADSEIENVIDARLTEMISGFKKKIPMIGMFLSQTKENELKESAKEELLQMIPEIKQKFLSGSQKMEQIVKKLLKPMLKRCLIIAIGVGAILGLLEALMLMVFL